MGVSLEFANNAIALSFHHPAPSASPPMGTPQTRGAAGTQRLARGMDCVRLVAALPLKPTKSRPLTEDLRALIGLAWFVCVASVASATTTLTWTTWTSTGRPPVIGINMDVSESTGSVSYRAGSTYVNAIIQAGGVPILLPAITNPEGVRLQVAACDGFVMTGGRDIDPSKYGQQPHPTHNALEPLREQYDFLLIDEILKSRKPILGVCLGAQELNVALGGSLMQDIPSLTSTTINHRQDEIRSEPSHEIHFTTGTRLADALGTTTLAVNSFHHQSCDQPGKGVIITARAPDGVVEAYEVENHPFAVGIQWHPEGMTSNPLHLRVYETLVKEADAHANRANRIKQ